MVEPKPLEGVEAPFELQKWLKKMSLRSEVEEFAISPPLQDDVNFFQLLSPSNLHSSARDRATAELGFEVLKDKLSINEQSTQSSQTTAVNGGCERSDCRKSSEPYSLLPHIKGGRFGASVSPNLRGSEKTSLADSCIPEEASILDKVKDLNLTSGEHLSYEAPLPMVSPFIKLNKSPKIRRKSLPAKFYGTSPAPTVEKQGDAQVNPFYTSSFFGIYQRPMSANNLQQFEGKLTEASSSTQLQTAVSIEEPACPVPGPPVVSAVSEPVKRKVRVKPSALREMNVFSPTSM